MTDGPAVVDDPFAPEPAPAPQQQRGPDPQAPSTPQAPPVGPFPNAPPPNTKEARRPGRAGAGLSLLLGCTGATVGTAVGGAWGGLSGILLAGALRNSLRAATTWTSQDAARREEAKRSATVALLGWFLGGVTAYQAHEACQKKAEE